VSGPLLVCRGVEKRFGDVRAVDGVDLALGRGQVLALLGPSGCGKTTLLRLIAGFESPESGEIVLGDRVLNAPSRFVAPEKRRVAMVFQEFALFPHLDVAGNIAFGLPRGAHRRDRVGQLLTLVGLEGLDARMPHQLSGGQQQRVALARALASDPELILLDEPFSNLDPSTRHRVRAEVKQLIRSVGITAVFVTHDQEEALSLAEQVGVMIAGRLLQIGTPAEIYARPVTRSVAEFVGGANVLPGRVVGSTVEYELGRLPAPPALTGRVDVLLRAESLMLDEQGVEADVLSVEYYGHDQLLTARLPSGAVVRVRLLAAPPMVEGARVRLGTRGDALVLPAEAPDEPRV
jgi:iron(III) transport system ATP-binding protein